MRTIRITPRVLALLLSFVSVRGGHGSAGAQAPAEPAWHGQASTAPVWPGDSHVAEEASKGHYVFLSADGEKIVLLVPTEVEVGPGQPRRIDTIAPVRVLTVPFKNRIDPHLTVTISRDDPGSYNYVYNLRNGTEAKDSIMDWDLFVPCDKHELFQMSHERWHCIRSRSAIWKQVELPMINTIGCKTMCLAHDNRYDNQLGPGREAKGFRIVTELKPGFTTGEASHYPPFDIPLDVPDVVRSQLIQLGDPDKYFLTLGPRFSEDTPAPTMAADYLAGIKRLIETKRLDAQSGFVSELQSLLRKVRTGESQKAIPRAAPRTELEIEILEALRTVFNGG